MDIKLYCKICGKCFKSITHKHLKKHNMTIKEYTNKFNLKNKDLGLSRSCIWKGKSSKLFYKDVKSYEEKVHKSLKGRVSPNKGQKMSEEQKKKIGIANKGKICSKETRKKLSDSHKGNITWNKGLTKETDLRVNKYANNLEGHIVTKEARRKIKKARLLQKHTWETSIEKKIQIILKELNIPFIKHKPILNIEHKYQCDIYIQDLNMIIECDGNYWHNYPLGTKNDKFRNIELKNAEYKILRLWEHQINKMNKIDFLNIFKESYYNQINI